MKKNFKLKISLEEYLQEDPDVTEFLSTKNDSFWENLKISSQMPVEDLIEKDPTTVIVGKEEEIRIGKLVNYRGAQIELQREMRFSDMLMLLLEIDYLKKNGFRTFIEKEEQNMDHSPTYDWEDHYKRIISQLEEQKKYNRKKTLKYLLRNLESIVLDAEVDYNKISEKLRDELPTPPIFYLEGPMGAGKSFIQRRLQLSYLDLAKKIGIRGFDVLAIRDPLDSNRPKVIKLLGGDGLKLTNYFDNKMRKDKIKSKWKKRITRGLIYSPIVYGSVKLGYEIAKYSWGGGIGVDPFLDLWMWADKNFHWIAFATGMGIADIFVSIKKKQSSKEESKRPQWLSNSKNLPPVYVGAVGRENLEGEYKETKGMPPQNWLRGAGMMASDGNVVIIEQLPELTPDEQSWLSQLIQEREISIGNKGEFTIDVFPIIYMGANPHLVENIEQPLIDRLQLGKSCSTTNEIERTLKTERKMFLFLEYYRKTKGCNAFEKEALEALLEISSKIAEDKSKLEISRRYLSILDAALDIASQEKSDYITKEHAIRALVETKSVIEQTLENKIKEHQEKFIISDEPKKVGAVKTLCYLTDKYVIDHKNEEIKKQIEDENGIGYISQVTAKVKESKGEGKIKIITSKKWKNKEELKEKLKLLLEDKTNLQSYDITIDLTRVLNEDDSLLPAMYIATISAIEGKEIKQDTSIATNCDLMDKKLLPVTKINKRLYTTTKEDIGSVIVSEYDFNQKVNTNLQIGPEVKKARTLNELYEVLKL